MTDHGEAPPVPCKTCGEPALGERCDACWELEHRLDEYLKRGGIPAWDVVYQALARAAEKR